MAASMNRLVGFLFIVLALVSCTTAQTTHVVGGSTGWTVTSAITYTSWASNQVFRVGDSLVFNFAGTHDVATVTNRAAYDACNASSAIGPVQTTSPVRITLNSQGPQYYFCTIQGHCSIGQKLTINVVGAAASPPPTTTPTSPPPPPTRTPTPPTGSATPPTTTPTSSPPPPTNTATPPTTPVARPPTLAGGPPSNSAMGLAVSGFSVTFLSIAMAFFF